jgi:hypothetical protein
MNQHLSNHYSPHWGDAPTAHNPELWMDHAASMRMVHMAEGFELDAALG